MSGAIQESRSDTCPSTVESRLAEGHEAANFLRHAIVQATVNERGNYGKEVLARVKSDNLARTVQLNFVLGLEAMEHDGQA